MSVQLALSVVVFVAVLVSLSALSWGLTARQEARRRQIAHRLGLEQGPTVALRIDRAHERWPLRWMRDLIGRAGMHEEVRHLLARILAAALGGVVITGLLFRGPVAVLGLLFGLLPVLLMARRANKRSVQLAEQLPDALDRIGRTLRAGHAFPDALRSAAAELPAPIGEEFARVSEANRLGVDLRTCLEALANQHPDSFDLRLFVSAVLLNRETGGNLVEILDHLAETVRERLIFHQKVVALTAETNVSAIILGALPFVVSGILILLRPAYLLPLLTTTPGRILLFIALGSLFLGLVLMRAFARVEV